MGCSDRVPDEECTPETMRWSAMQEDRTIRVGAPLVEPRILTMRAFKQWVLDAWNGAIERGNRLVKERDQLREAVVVRDAEIVRLRGLIDDVCYAARHVGEMAEPPPLRSTLIR